MKVLCIAARSVLNNLAHKSPEIEAKTFGACAHSTRMRARKSCACASEGIMWWRTEPGLLGCDVKTHGEGSNHTATPRKHTIPCLVVPKPERGGRGNIPRCGAGCCCWEVGGKHQCLQVLSTWTCSRHRASCAEIMKGWPSSDAGTKEGWRMLLQRLTGMRWIQRRKQRQTVSLWRRYLGFMANPSTRSRLGRCVTSAAVRWRRDTGEGEAPPPQPELQKQQRRGESPDRRMSESREMGLWGWNTRAVKVNHYLRSSAFKLYESRPGHLSHCDGAEVFVLMQKTHTF